MMKLDRRKFLKSATGITALALGMNPSAPAFLRRLAMAAPPAMEDSILVYVFQRGGNDGLNTVIPLGDPQYNATMRPNIYVSSNDAITLTDAALAPNLQNNFAGLHPGLAPLTNLYNAGQMAYIHRVGYKGQSQSHFDSQQFYENGTSNPRFEEGILYRLAVEKLDLANNPVAAVSISSNLMVAFKGTVPTANIPSLSDFGFGYPLPKERKLLGRPYGDGITGRGIQGAYTLPPLSGPYRENIYRTGQVLAEALSLAKRLNPATYVPENGAVYSANSSLQQKFKQAAMEIKDGVRMVGINQGGYDTHTGQGGATGGQRNLLYDLAQGIQALSMDLGPTRWGKTVLVVVSEFGRTTNQNGSFGTDHGDSTVMMVTGGKVKGGVYNCDSTKWAAGDVYSSSSGRYVKRLTDHRSVMKEIIEKHYGVDAAGIARIIPNYSTLVAAAPTEFSPIGIL